MAPDAVHRRPAGRAVPEKVAEPTRNAAHQVGGQRFGSTQEREASAPEGGGRFGDRHRGALAGAAVPEFDETVCDSTAGDHDLRDADQFGVTRILAIIAELNNDDKGLIWPATVAPFDVYVVATGRDAAVFEAADTVVAQLEEAGFDVLYDDRPKVSPGVKFGDAELIGIPKIVIAGRGVADGLVELWDRRTGERTPVPIAEAAAALKG